MILDLNHDEEDDMQTLVTSDSYLTNNVHNNVGDTLLLIENGELSSNMDNKKVFT
jgi:hypothetical protein